MRWNKSYVLILSAIALGFYIVADLSLVEMLGRHPLQSEITLIDRHLQNVEKEQAKVQQKKNEKTDPPDGIVEDQVPLREMLVYGVSGGILFLGPIALFWILRRRKNGRPIFPVEASKASIPYVFKCPHPSWSFVFILSSLLMAGTGGLYIYEGHRGQGHLHGVVTEIGLRAKQRRTMDEKKRVKEEVVKGLMVRDGERKQKGFVFAILGSLLLVGTIYSGPRHRPPV